jgi:L-fuconolactonase
VTVVDAHVHLWDLDVRPQPWTDDFPVLKRSFGADELSELLAGNGVDRAVVVQGSDSWDETLDLLRTASDQPTLAGVIGWVDLTRPDVAEQVATLRGAPGGQYLLGVRHQLQLEPDKSWFSRPEVRSGLGAVAAAGLVYDVVVSPEQMPQVIETVSLVPELSFVLDHAGKPPIASAELAGWRSSLHELALLPNIAVKLSGLITEAEWIGWSQADLDPVIEHVLTCFGPARTMAGSDWPVCLLAADYRAVRATLAAALERLSPTGREQVLGRTAIDWYKIPAAA